MPGERQKMGESVRPWLAFSLAAGFLLCGCAKKATPQQRRVVTYTHLGPDTIYAYPADFYMIRTGGAWRRVDFDSIARDIR